MAADGMPTRSDALSGQMSTSRWKCLASKRHDTNYFCRKSRPSGSDIDKRPSIREDGTSFSVHDLALSAFGPRWPNRGAPATYEQNQRECPSVCVSS